MNLSNYDIPPQKLWRMLAAAPVRASALPFMIGGPIMRGPGPCLVLGMGLLMIGDAVEKIARKVAGDPQHHINRIIEDSYQARMGEADQMAKQRAKQAKFKPTP